MRATLWQGASEASDIVREILRGLFCLADISFAAVSTRDELLAAASRARRHSDKDILIVDCFQGEPGDFDRCVTVITRTSLAVYIVHPREQSVRNLEAIAGRPLMWLPTTATIEDLVDKLHLFRALAAVDHVVAEQRPKMTVREREVAELMSTGCSNHVIMQDLHLTENTVKTYVHTLFRKFGVSTRPEFIAVYLGLDEELHAFMAPFARKRDASG